MLCILYQGTFPVNVGRIGLPHFAKLGLILLILCLRFSWILRVQNNLNQLLPDVP